MIFGNPYRFAIWVEDIPLWGGSVKNGLFSLMVNGNLYPDDIRTATLSVELFEITSNNCALVSLPGNEVVFNMPTQDAFKYLLELTYPESTDENEYPDQVFDYCILSSNVSDYGGRFFAVANKDDLRIIGGKTEHLIDSPDKDGKVWGEIRNVLLEDVIISRGEVNKIIADLKEYISLNFR